MTPKTPEDYSDPTGSGDPTIVHETQDAPALTFEQYVRLEFASLILVQKEHGKQIKNVQTLLAGLDDLPRKIARELMNELLSAYADQFEALNQAKEIHARKIKQLEDEQSRMREQLDARTNGH